MSDNDIVPLRRSFVNQLVSTVKWVRQQQGRGFRPEQIGKSTNLNRVQVILTEDLPACEDPLGQPTSAKFIFLDELPDGTLQRRLLPDGETYHEGIVYNREALSVTSGSYLRVHRLADRWVPLVGGGGGGEIIQFAPFDVCEGIGFTCDCVQARVVTATCGSGLAPGDEVQVWDQSRGWFQMPEDLLYRSVGWAHKVKITETDVYEGLPFYLGECRWVVISMDCIEQEPAS